MGKRQWAFIMDRFKKLQSGEIAWDSIREYVKEREDLDHCVYCGQEKTLTLEHLFPRAFRGPEDEKNAVWACAACNSAKGARRLYEFWAERGASRPRSTTFPASRKESTSSSCTTSSTRQACSTWTRGISRIASAPGATSTHYVIGRILWGRFPPCAWTVSRRRSCDPPPDRQADECFKSLPHPSSGAHDSETPRTRRRSPGS